MEDYKLCRIFFDVYHDIVIDKKNFNQKNNEIPLSSLFNHSELLENRLLEFISKFISYKVKYNYDEYIREIIKYFENLIINSPSKDIEAIIEFSKVYEKSYFEEIYKRPTVALFINTMKQLYCDDITRSIVLQRNSTYIIGKVEKKNEYEMPFIIIRDIDNFEQVLLKFIDKIEISDTFFSSPLKNLDKEDAMCYIFEWIIKNATSKDLSDVERFFEKYGDFITDKTFDGFTNYTCMDKLLGRELYLKRKKANINYETPFYLSYVLKKEDNTVTELPNVRLGIEDGEKGKVAHILATQTSQDTSKNDDFGELIAFFKKMILKTKYFREFNPSHLISLIITFGLLKGLGIDQINVTDYFPLRLQRLILENQKSEEELYNLQSRLTEKNVYNYLKILENFQGIDIIDYVDNGDGLLLKISDEVTSNNEFFQKLYNIGLNQGIKFRNVHNKEKTK